MTNPYKIVEIFEEAIADYAGSKYAVAVESCTVAIFLSLLYVDVRGKSVSLPKFTYPGVATHIIHAGGRLHFTEEKWSGAYQLYPFRIVDAALRFRKGMYEETSFYCLSFHSKKLLPIGRGGAILTDDEAAYEWFKLMRFDGRHPVPLQQDRINLLGYNCYMQPEQAARGMMLLQSLGDRELPDLTMESQKYSDLSTQPVYQKYIV